MNFAEKMSLLMDITKTTNSALAHGVSLDASYISRLRSGKRKIPKDESMIRDISAFLLRRVSEDYQKRALADELKLSDRAKSKGPGVDELTAWLMREGPEDSRQPWRFLSSPEKEEGAEELTAGGKDLVGEDAMSVYYGVEGKRRAAESFLRKVAASKTAQTLFLFSDEETSWMTEDTAFAQRWAELMGLVLSQGHRIKIIHTLSRDLDEMLNAVRQWMPLYMSGAIEPYFYPRKRDGIFKRTLFIAPGIAAVASNSVGGQVSKAANVLYREPNAVASFAEEFLEYLRLCRPLMRIFTASERENCYEILAEFERAQADAIIKTETLSLLTMPQALLEQILNRTGIAAEGIMDIHSRRCKLFTENLAFNNFSEIISLPKFESLVNGEVKISFSDMLEGGQVYYTREEFAAHLEQIILLLGTNEKYRVYLIENQREEPYTVYGREMLGAIVAKTSQPAVVLAINEDNITAALWDFLKSNIGEKLYTAERRAATLASLRGYRAKLAGFDG